MEVDGIVVDGIVVGMEEGVEAIVGGVAEVMEAVEAEADVDSRRQGGLHLLSYLRTFGLWLCNLSRSILLAGRKPLPARMFSEPVQTMLSFGSVWLR